MLLEGGFPGGSLVGMALRAKLPPSSIPGARVVAVALTDSSGNFWPFAGGGVDSAGTSGYRNDLWKYEP
jgi:hypothetical protein